MNINKILIAAAATMAMALSACSTQTQVESNSQVAAQGSSQSQVTPVPVSNKPRVVIKNRYIKAKHCHTFKGYGWNKRVCHAHPAPHKHGKKYFKKRSSKPSIAHSHNGRRHSHPFTNPNHKHRKGTGAPKCTPCVSKYR